VIQRYLPPTWQSISLGTALPFAEAYDTVGKLVARAAELNVPLDRVRVNEVKSVSALFGEQMEDIFNGRASLNKRKAPGAPSPQNVADRILYWQQQLG
jgi:argininosuccinate lyase